LLGFPFVKIPCFDVLLNDSSERNGFA